MALDISIDFQLLYVRISYHVQDKARYWSKIAISAPVGGLRRNIAITFGMEKTRMVWLPDGEKSLRIMFSRFDTIPACDRQMDRRTFCASIVALRIASRGKTEKD